MIVAEAIAEILDAEGMSVAAGIWGQSASYLAEALARNSSWKIYYTRQERVAVDICDGYARVSGQPAVMFTDAGPAAANAMGGIVNSWGDSVPVLFLAGHNDRFEVQRHTTKELPLVEIFGPVSKWTTVLLDSSQLEKVLRRAFIMLRSPRTGPVVIGLPFDLSYLETAHLSYTPVGERLRSGGDPVDIENAVRKLAAAERPYVYVGAGVLSAGASEELVELASLLTLPVATTLNGKSAFPENHPLALGIGGFSRALYSTLQAETLAAEADLVMTVGCGFKKHATQAPMSSGTTHIQVDADPSELHKESRADLAILGDAKVVLRQMVEAARAILPHSRFQPRSELIRRVQSLRERWWALSRPLITSSETPVNPFRVTWELSQLVDPDQTIVLHDAGSTRGTTCQHYVATVPHSFVGFGVESAMGWSLGAAIGAKAAAPDKLVVAVMGDEAFGETAMDLETAVLSQAPILVVLNNNRADIDSEVSKSPALSPIRFAGGRNYASLAAALGAASEHVEDPNDLRPALQRAIRVVQEGRPCVVEVVTKRVRATLQPLYREAAAADTEFVSPVQLPR